MKSYDEAEEGFRNTIKLIDEAVPEANELKAPALSELARLLNNTNQHAKAIPIFKKAVEELELRKTSEFDPIGYVNFLKMYAESLKQLNNLDYLRIVENIENITSQYPNAKAKVFSKSY